MALTIRTLPHLLACRDAVTRLAEDARACGKRPVLLVESYSQQLSAQKWLAERGDGFAIAVSTLFSWVNELWELLGDGSRVVAGETRVVELWKLLKENAEWSCENVHSPKCEEAPLQASAGVLNLLNRCATEALPCLQDSSTLAPEERRAIRVLDQYRERLRASNMIEISEILSELSSNSGIGKYAPIVYGIRDDQLTYVQRQFLDACDAVLVTSDHSEPSPVSRAAELLDAQRLLFQRKADDSPVVPSGAVSLELAAGPSAAKRSTLDAIFRVLGESSGNVVVASANPCALFDYCAGKLAESGFPCTLLAKRPLGDTDMGRALMNLGTLLEVEDVLDPMSATPLASADYAYNPFSSIGCADAFFVDRLHRRDRLTTQDAILTDLSSHADDALQGVIPLLEAGDHDAALDGLMTYLNRHYSGNPSYFAEQARVLETVRAFCREGSGLSFTELVKMAAETPVTVSLGTVCEDDVEPGGLFSKEASSKVMFMTLSEAAQLEPGSVDCMVLAGMNTFELPVREMESALTTLLGKLGVKSQPDPLAQLRDMFYRAFEAAVNRVVVQRCLNDEKGNPAQPATVFEELLDCYRIDPRTDEGMDRTLNVPQVLLPYVFQRGEQDVLLNAGAPKRSLQSAPEPITGMLPESDKSLVVLPHRYKEGLFDGLDVSPSQVESYLECPYNWFAKRRLRLEGLDEGFSPLERGTFMHDVLRRFYLRFQADVQPKVTADTLGIAREIMRKTFDEVCADQPMGRFGSRYVPLSAWERKEQQAVLPKLLDYLDVETRLLPTFAPREFEWVFAADRPMPYAGCNLRGCVDRIDVDDRGRAVVIDYKSSLGTQYRLYDAYAKEQPDAFELPKRLQAIMYAKIVREHFGYQVVGALYVNPLTGAVLGVFDGTQIGAADIPFTGKRDCDNCRVPYPFAQSFDEFMDKCETAIGEKLEHLMQGDVEPLPATKDACSYCPVNVCPQRLAPRKM